MSSYASVYVHGAEVFTWRNEIDPTFLFLFTSRDVKRVPKEPEEMSDDEDVETILLTTSARILADRLDVLGIGRNAVEVALREAVEGELESTRRFRQSLSDDWVDRKKAELGIDRKLGVLDGMSLTAWNELLAAALSAPEKPEKRDFRDPTSLEELLRIWEEYDPWYLLRAVLLSCKPDDDISLDVTELIAGGWMDGGFHPQSVATEHFSYALANGSPAVIITEGSVDRAALEATVRIRYPHLLSFIKFYDFGDGAEGSAAAGIRTLKSFAAAGISNRVVLILDNDTAARDAQRALRSAKLPKHYTVLRYPELELAKEYPTLGPGGLSEMDVNGLAGSIELYFGTDVLRRDDGNMSPVQWRSYIEGVGAYQGEIIDKVKVQKRFRDKVKDAERNPDVASTQDWHGLELIINAIIEELRA